MNNLAKLPVNGILKPTDLPLEIFLPRNLGVEVERDGERVATWSVGQFRRPLRSVHEVRMSGVVDEAASVGHRAHHAERVDVAAAVVLDGTQFAVDTRELVRLVDGRVTTFLVALGHHATRTTNLRRARLILLHTET